MIADVRTIRSSEPAIHRIGQPTSIKFGVRQSHAAVAWGPLRGGVLSYRAGHLLGALTETFVDIRDRSGELLCEELPDSCRGADWDDAAIRLGVRHTARGATAGIASLPGWRLRMIWTEHL